MAGSLDCRHVDCEQHRSAVFIWFKPVLASIYRFISKIDPYFFIKPIPCPLGLDANGTWRRQFQMEQIVIKRKMESFIKQAFTPCFRVDETKELTVFQKGMLNCIQIALECLKNHIGNYYAYQ